MVTFKPVLKGTHCPVSQHLDKLGTKFQQLNICVRGPANQWHEIHSTEYASAYSDSKLVLNDKLNKYHTVLE